VDTVLPNRTCEWIDILLSIPTVATTHMGEPSYSPTVVRSTTLGFVVYVAILTAAYYYSLTFVQLGLTEIGAERVGLSRELVAAAMGVLAVTTLTTTLVSGRLMDRLGWGTDIERKFRVLLAVLLGQLVVTYGVTEVSSFPQFLAGILACAVLLGTGIPFAFSLMLDLVAPGVRGYAAGAVTGCAFFLAVLFPFEWTASSFAPAAVVVLAPVVVLLGVLSVAPGLLTGTPRRQQRDGQNNNGGISGWTGMRAAPVVVGLVLLFGAFFIDSLGFVRIVETPAYVDTSWQSTDLATRTTIGLTHVAGGVVAGVLYTRLRYLLLFVATFALFAVAQFLYVYDITVGGPAGLDLAMPLVYVLAVSCYTTVTFALWPDLATPETVGTYTAIGVGFGGWMATFTSTALALVSDQIQLGVGTHLLVVGLLSVVFLSVAMSLWYLTAEHSDGGLRSLRA
jgi:MFS family permease